MPKDERSELVERLKDLCRDWGGEEIHDNSTPRDQITCGELRQIIAALTPSEQPQAGMVSKLRLLVEESLYHLRLDARAEDYHKRALAALDVTPSEQGSGLREALRGPVLEATLARTNWQKYNSEQGDEVVYQAEKMASAIAAIEDALSIGGFERLTQQPQPKA